MNLPGFDIHILPQTTSTNDEAMTALKQGPREKYTVFVTDFQTKGRGQQSNVWESEKGKNLLYSIGVSPSFLPPYLQFCLLQAHSLSICQTLCEIHPDFTIKWPNDIYWKDHKISGTLIECQLEGNRLKQCILGTGLNINQETFSPTLPNPISLKQIFHKEFQREQLLEKILTRFSICYQAIENGQEETIRANYLSLLYRREGFHSFRDKDGQFTASIAGITPQGKLILKDLDGRNREYFFKEVQYLLGEKAIN